MDLDVSEWTACRRLKEARLPARRPSRKPLISDDNRKARAKFARELLHWTKDDSEKFLWSDESKFYLFSSDCVQYVRRPVGKRFDVHYQVPTVKQGGESVMVWGCFSQDGVGPLTRVEGKMTAVDYRAILEEHMLPHAKEKMSAGWIFQQDNDPKHASILMTVLDDNFRKIYE